MNWDTKRGRSFDDLFLRIETRYLQKKTEHFNKDNAEYVIKSWVNNHGAEVRNFFEYMVEGAYVQDE